MKNTLLTIICLSLISFFGVASATSPSLDISPTDVIKTSGDVFQISLDVNSSGEKVCAVEGNLSFKNLSCQNITVANGVMAQSSPTCSNPYFLIGIPSCTTGDKPLLSISVKAGSAGTSSISTTGVDVMGEGTSLSNASTNGNYTITAPVVPITPVIPKTTIEPKETSGTIEEIPEEIIDQQSPEEEISSNPVVQDTSSESSVAQASLLSVVSNILSFGTGNGWLSAISILVILAILIFTITYFIKNRKKKIQ